MRNIGQILFAAWALVACGATSPKVDSRLDMFVYRDVTPWPDSSQIPVCWEPLDLPAESYSEEKAWVQEAISNSWSRANPKIQFVGWDTCPLQSSGLRIKIDNAIGGHTSGFGAALAGVPHGLQLSLDLSGTAINQPNDPRKICFTSRDSMKSCVQSIAIHEFGHALGLMHEQNRSDVASGCDKAQPYQSITGRAIGAYDPDSIMNYCNNAMNPQQTQLSVGDKEGILALYSGQNVGTQDPGRPTLGLDQEGIEVTSMVWGHDVDISVTYYSIPKIPAATLPDPAESLKIVGTHGDVSIDCGPWVISPLPSNLAIKKSRCKLTPPVNEPKDLGDFRWHGKFVASAKVDDASGAFIGLSRGSSQGTFQMNYTILVAPGVARPSLSLKVATVIPPEREIRTSAVKCTATEIAGKFLCTASSKTQEPSGTLVQLDGQIVVAGRAIKMTTAYSVVP